MINQLYRHEDRKSKLAYKYWELCKAAVYNFEWQPEGKCVINYSFEHNKKRHTSK